MKTRDILLLGGLAVAGYYLYKMFTLPKQTIVVPPPPQPQPQIVKKDAILSTPITTKYPIGQTPVEETKKLYPEAFKGSVLNVSTPSGTTASGTSGLLQQMYAYPSSSYSKLDPRIPNYR